MGTRNYFLVIAVCILCMNAIGQDLSSIQKDKSNYELLIEKQKTPLLETNGESFLLDGIVWQRSNGDFEFYLSPTLKNMNAVHAYNDRINSKNDKEKGICKSNFKIVKIALNPKSISLLSKFGIIVPDYIENYVNVNLPQIDIDRLIEEGIEFLIVKKSSNTNLNDIMPESGQDATKDLIWSEGFEGVFPGNNYLVGDVNADSGQDFWNDVNCDNYSGNWGLWCSGEGSQTDCSEYDNDMNAYAANTNGIDVSAYTDVTFEFMAQWNIETDYDNMNFFCSPDGINYTFVSTYDGNSNGWYLLSFTLTGYTDYYWELDFNSDGSLTYFGATIDDMEISGEISGDPPIADFDANPTSGEVPLMVNFTDQSTNLPTAWSWSFGDGSTSYQQNPEHTYNSVGNYTVTLTVTNSFGNDTETKSNYINVSNQPPPAEANFNATPTEGDAPLTVYFTDESINSPTSWSWDFGDGATSDQQNPQHIYTEAGSYSVSLTVSNEYGGNTETKTNFIVVNNAPLPQLFVDITNIDLGSHACGQTFECDFNITNTGAGELIGTIATDADWIAIDPNNFNLGSNQQVSVKLYCFFSSEGIYKSDVNIYSNAGDEDVSILGFGTLGIDDHILQNALLVYPNPADDHISIEIQNPNLKVKHIKIYNLLGKSSNLDFSSNFTNSIIDISSLETGLYCLQVSTNKGNIFKWIVVR